MAFLVATRLPLQLVAMLMMAAIILVNTGCDGPDIDLKESPMAVISETPGYGLEARDGMLVTLDYHIYTESGETILRDTGYAFVLGQGAVIRGIDEAVVGMKLGGVKTISCPPQRHWGRAGYGDGAVPPDTTLLMRLALKRVETVEDDAAAHTATRKSTDRRFSAAGDGK